jgi:hypothetical protein
MRHCSPGLRVRLITGALARLLALAFLSESSDERERASRWGVRVGCVWHGSWAPRLTAPALEVCFFTASGSEANELALRPARAHTGARDLLVMDAAYHGHTTTLIDISPYKHAGPSGTGAPDWVHPSPIPDLCSGPVPGGGSRHRYEVTRSSGAEPVQLTYFRGPPTGTPRWSPDGRRLAFDSRVGGMGSGLFGRVDHIQNDIMLCSTSGDRPGDAPHHTVNTCRPTRQPPIVPPTVRRPRTQNNNPSAPNPKHQPVGPETQNSNPSAPTASVRSRMT